MRFGPEGLVRYCENLRVLLELLPAEERLGILEHWIEARYVRFGPEGAVQLVGSLPGLLKLFPAKLGVDIDVLRSIERRIVGSKAESDCGAVSKSSVSSAGLWRSSAVRLEKNWSRRRLAPRHVY